MEEQRFWLENGANGQKKARREGRAMQRKRRELRKSGNWAEDGEGIAMGGKGEGDMGGKG